MADIVWEDPPPVTRPSLSGHLTAFVEELKKYPGKWAAVRTYRFYNSPARERLIRLGCESVNRVTQREPLQVTLYARWPEDAS